MKIALLDDTDEVEMYLRLDIDGDGIVTLYAYPSSNLSLNDEVVIGEFREDGLHLAIHSVDGWPTDKNGYIKIVRDR